MKRISFLLAALAIGFLPTLASAQNPLVPAPLRPELLALSSGTKTASATAGAATLNKPAGVITSETITTAAGADYVLTLTDSSIAAADTVFVSVANGTNTTEGLSVNRVQPGAGSVVIHIRNTHASAALNGTIKLSFMALKN